MSIFFLVSDSSHPLGAMNIHLLDCWSADLVVGVGSTNLALVKCGLLWCSFRAWLPLSAGLPGVAGCQYRMVEVGDMSPILLP